MILAILGFFVPGLPCTLALLSAVLLPKAHRLYNWLLKNRYWARIRDYQRRRGVTKSGKVKVIVLMMIMVLISSFPDRFAAATEDGDSCPGLVGAIVVWFLVPEGENIPRINPAYRPGSTSPPF